MEESRDTDKFYTLSDVMKILRISRSTMYKLVREEGFPKLRFCGKYLIPKAEFEQWCKSHCSTEKI